MKIIIFLARTQKKILYEKQQKQINPHCLPFLYQIIFFFFEIL